jgi:WD40 repeat protein
MLKLWDLTQKHDQLHSTELPGGLLEYGLSPDGYALFLREPNGRYTVRNVFRPGRVPILSATNSTVSGGAVAPQGALLALALEDGSIQLWTNRSATYELTHQWKAHAGRIPKLTFSRDGRLLATVGADAKAAVWSTTTFGPVATTNFPGSEFLSVNFSHDSQVLGLGCEDGTAVVWHLGNPASVITLAGHQYSVSCVASAPDGRVATVSDDGTVKLWDLSRPGQPRVSATLRGPLTGLQTAVFSPDGQRLAAGGGVGEGELCVWDTATGLQVARLAGHRQRVMALAFTEDDTLVSVSPEAMVTWGAASLAEADKMP